MDQSLASSTVPGRWSIPNKQLLNNQMKALLFVSVSSLLPQCFMQSPDSFSPQYCATEIYLLEVPKDLQWPDAVGMFYLLRRIRDIWHSPFQEILILSFKGYQSFLIFLFLCSLASPILLFFLCPPFKCWYCLRCHPQGLFLLHTTDS